MMDLYYWTTPNGHKMQIGGLGAGQNHQLRPIRA
jgi:hypothetical protein